MEDTRKLKEIIANAIADGRLSRKESLVIKRAIYQDKKVTRQEARLWRELQMKIVSAEILLD